MHVLARLSGHRKRLRMDASAPVFQLPHGPLRFPVTFGLDSPWIIPEFAGPVAPEPVDFRGLPGSPKFPGNPHDHSPCSPTPAGPGTCYGTKGQRTRHGPRTKAQRGLQTVANFGAQSHGFWSRCLRLVVMVSHHCTQDSLPAAGPSFAGRDSNPQGFYERFLSISTRPPLPSFLGASFVLALFYHRQVPPFGFTGHYPLATYRRDQRGQLVRRPTPSGYCLSPTGRVAGRYCYLPGRVRR